MINMLKAFVSLHCSRLVALPQDVRVPSVLPRLNACDRTGGRLRSMGGWLPMASRANGCGSPLHVVLCEAAGLHVGPSPEAIASVLATGWVDRGGSVFEAPAFTFGGAVLHLGTWRSPSLRDTRSARPGCLPSLRDTRSARPGCLSALIMRVPTRPLPELSALDRLG